jgi:hypothetical protein
MQERRQAERQERLKRPRNRWQVAAAFLGVFMVALLALLGLGYVTDWGWVGVAEEAQPNTFLAWLGVVQETQYKTLWDWLDLLFVPAAIAISIFLLDQAQRAREQVAQEDQQRRHRLELEEQRERELRVEDQRAQDTALQAYLDQMGALLLDKGLSSSPRGAVVRTLARARTLTILTGMDGRRKWRILQFLSEGELITNGEFDHELGTVVNQKESGDLPIIMLDKADLTKTRLPRSELLGSLNLVGAVLVECSLVEATLTGINASEAKLGFAKMRNTDLSGALLIGADLEDADLESANLAGAQLMSAYLGGATLANPMCGFSDE